MDQIPIYMGAFEPLKEGSIRDFGLNVSPDLDTGDTVSTVTFTVEDAAGETVADVVTDITESDTGVDFRVEAPDAGAHKLVALFTLSDGQVFTRTADLRIV